ncbi:MAG TPA: hypothetical protein VI455_06845 [Terriglobia bacterium]
MRTARLFISLFLFAFLTFLLYGADVTGQWKSQAGDDPPFSFTLKSDGSAVTGTMVSTEGKDLPISDGKLDGDTISFSVASEWQGQPIKLVAKGKVAADQIQLHIGTDDGAWGTDTALKRSSGK